MTAALAALRVDVGHQALGLLNIPGAGHPADLGEVLADELVGIQDDTFLVLDDYDSVQDRGIHEVLAALLSQPPPCLHVVIAARADPPLPLHRLRARGQLLEVRASDLRFAGGECAFSSPDPRGSSRGSGRRPGGGKYGGVGGGSPVGDDRYARPVADG